MPRKRKTPVPAVAPGGPYGSRKATEEALAAVPITSSGPSGSSSPVAAPSPMDVAAAWQPSSPGLAGPTRYPNEPFSAGLDVGPGPGPSQSVAGDPFSNPQLPPQLMVSLEMLASLRDASDATRNLVRRLRSRL